MEASQQFRQILLDWLYFGWEEGTSCGLLDLSLDEPDVHQTILKHINHIWNLNEMLRYICFSFSACLLRLERSNLLASSVTSTFTDV